jgi:hypothetical protein
LVDVAAWVIGVVHSNARMSAEYIDQTGKLIELGKIIMTRLGPGKVLFLSYEVLVGLTTAKLIENAYRLGMKDGQNGVGCAVRRPTKCPTEVSYKQKQCF